MRYLGGKSRTRNKIAGYLNLIRQPGQPYWEPFVGAGWVLEKVAGEPRYASDANPYLIAMWQALQGGWEPPDVVTEEDYQRAKAGDCEPHLRAFIGFGCSFGGKWFAGYARGEGRNFAKEGRNRLLATLGKVREVRFFTANFLTYPPPAPACLIYCDPPYDDTEGYGGVPSFDTLAFWERVRQLESQGHTLIASEYQAPNGFTCVVRSISRMGLDTTNGKEARIERLFRLGQHTPLQPALLELDAER